MKITKKYTVCFALVLFLFGAVLFAEKTPIEHLYEYKLDNGLTLFAAENHSVPLVYIELAVRAGAVAQTPQNAGLFHLYEHMMFKGNAKYPSAEAIQYAIKDLGVASWNGSTSTDMVNYFFTIPSDKLEEGLSFWSSAVRDPLMTPAEFEAEKKVVISEITGGSSDPSWQLNGSMTKNLFPASPWIHDPAGSAEIVQNATVSQLRDMQQRYYTPNNTALFVGGDIDPDQVYALVNKIYGSWKRGADVWETPSVQQSINPLSAPSFHVMPYPVCAPQTAQILVLFRGPDLDFDLNGTYAADTLFNFLNEPAGTFRQTLVKNKELQIPDTNYISAGYQTMRQTSIMQIAATVISPETNLPARAKLFLSQVTEKILPSIAADKKLYTQTKMKEAMRHLRDIRVYETETASSLLSSLRYWWVTNSAEYYYTYIENMEKVGKADVSSVLEKYVFGKNPMVIVVVNPQVYEQTKDDFAANGFAEITADNAFWWKAAASLGDAK